MSAPAAAPATSPERHTVILFSFIREGKQDTSSNREYMVLRVPGDRVAEQCKGQEVVKSYVARITHVPIQLESCKVGYISATVGAWERIVRVLSNRRFASIVHALNSINGLNSEDGDLFCDILHDWQEVRDHEERLEEQIAEERAAEEE